MSRARILIVDDDRSLREAIADTLKLAGYECLEADSGIRALTVLASEKADMVVSDIQMAGMDGHTLLNSIASQYPGLPVLLMTAYANIDGAVRAMRDGAVDYLSKPFAPEVLLNQVSRYVPASRVEKKDLICGDEFTRKLMGLAVKVAKTDASVMITGPSGTGKEVLSRYIHDNSARRDQPFVAINCAAIPESMLEATLFGYEKGAFTGAVQSCPGKFEQAQGGTILLDEITEMNLDLQAKLLRVLQEREVERLGGRKMIRLDVRVLATSNRNLKQAIAEGKFREDLYYRLNVFPLEWKALKDRRGDIIPLAEHLLQIRARENGCGVPKLDESAKKTLIRYSFPGNVRELDNIMQRALILSQNGVIDQNSLMMDGDLLADGAVPASAVETEPADSAAQNEEAVESEIISGRQNDSEVTDSFGTESLGFELKQQENQIILDALNACNGSRKAVAERLGISPRTLRYKIAKMKEMGCKVPEIARFEKPLPNFV
jgi:two-component system response regulator FlrC